MSVIMSVMRNHRFSVLSAVGATVALCLVGRAFAVHQPAADADTSAPSSATEIRGKALVIAHRGASVERPEHTLGAYQLAMEQGADYVEPDLRMTKDKVFIALHDSSLNRTTDVADKPEFKGRARMDNKGRPYWISDDFTLAELKTLRTRQGYAKRSADHDYQETIPTLKEIVDLVRTYNKKTGRTVGLVPELRGDADAFVAFVRKHGLEDSDRGLPLYLQSFDLNDLKKALPQLKSPGAWLITKWPDEKQQAQLKGIVDAVAVSKNLVMAGDARERIAEMHGAGFDVIAWTFADDSFDKRFENGQEELVLAVKNGVDAFFTDSPATGVAVRNQHRETTSKTVEGP